jgi:site-specific recombinase XerD
MLLQDAIRGFGRYQRMRGRTAGTERSYAYLIEQFGRWLDGQALTWDAVSGDQIESFLEGYRETHSRTSTALFSTCLSSFYRWAKRRRHVTTNPTEDLEPITRDRPQPRALSDSRVRELLDAIETLHVTQEDRRNRIIVRMFLHSGLRLAELTALDRRDLDMDARTIIVREAKGGRTRIIAMNDTLHTDLVDWPEFPSSGPLFMCSRGRLSAAGISEMFRTVVQRKLGFEEITAHVLRHTHGTTLRRNGADLRGIQVQMGHQKPETTAIYTRVWDEELHGVVARLDSAW